MPSALNFRYRWNDIALFVQVVRYGSFAETARRLGVPPNPSSLRIQQLEERLSTRLMQRSTRKLTLTSAGEAFHERCAGAVDGLVEAGQEMIAGNQEPSGLVRVAAPADFFDFFPMAWVADFLAEHPRVRLDFVLNDAETDLIAEQIDIAFRGGRFADPASIGRLILGAGSDGMLVSPAYLARRGAPATLQELADHDCMSVAHPGGHNVWRLVGPDGAVDVPMTNASPATPSSRCAKPLWPVSVSPCCRLPSSGSTSRPARLCLSCPISAHKPRPDRAVPEPSPPAAGGVGVYQSGGGKAGKTRITPSYNCIAHPP